MVRGILLFFFILSANISIFNFNYKPLIITLITWLILLFMYIKDNIDVHSLDDNWNLDDRTNKE